MLQWGAAEGPERILQTLGQSDKALAAEHDMRVLPAGEGQPEVIEPVIECNAGDADAAIAHIGKIRQPEPARRVLLPKDDVLLGAVERPPGANAPLQSAANAGRDLGMAAADLIENGDRPQARRALQQRHNLAVPDCRQRIPPSAAARYLLL